MTASQDVEEEEAAVLRLLPLADRMARTHARRHPASSIEDATSDAYLAVTLAVRTHDPTRGSGDLRAYASWRVKLALVDGLRTRLGAVLDDPEKESLRRAAKNPTHRFEDPVGRGHLTLADVLPEPLPDGLSAHELIEVRLDLDRARLSLTPKERALVADYFEGEWSLREIGEARGVTEGAVSRSLRLALGKLGRAYGGTPRPLLTRGGVTTSGRRTP